MNSKNLKKKINKELCQKTALKDWADNKGVGYSTKTEAQAASFINFIIAGFRTGFPVVINRFWYTAIAIYPFVLIRKDSITTERLNHERIHIKQQLELFIIGGYVWYAVELWIRIIKTLSIKKAYFTHSMERECREHQGNANYLLFRKKYSFIKYLKDAEVTND